MDTVTLIGVIWLKPGTGEIVSAFEIEKSTSIFVISLPFAGFHVTVHLSAYGRLNGPAKVLLFPGITVPGSWAMPLGRVSK